MAIISQALTEEQRERIRAKIDRARTMADTREKVVPEFATPPDGIQCPHCGNTGWTYEVTDDGYESVRACPYCYERRQVVRRLQHSGISPRDYARFNLITFDPGKTPDSAKMLALAEKYLAEHTFGGPGFGVFGSSGMGKTHICIAVCQELTRRYREPHHYFSYRSIMPGLVKASKSFKDDYEAEMQKWVRYPNLYIDDMFKFSGKQIGDRIVIDQDELRVFFDLINARYLSHKTTLFSSEYTVKDIAAIDGALGSRIYDMVKPYGLAVSGPNQRLVG